MQREPNAITPLEQALTSRIGELVEDVSVSPDEDLRDEALL
jgi:hypothetical protein